MKLQKKIYKKNDTINSMDRSFSSIKRTKDDDISISKFFHLYEKLFYQIPKTGTTSHSYIINKSSNYADGVLKNKEEEIKILKNRILELEARVSHLDSSKDIIEFEKNIQEQENFNLKNS